MARDSVRPPVRRPERAAAAVEKPSGNALKFLMIATVAGAVLAAGIPWLLKGEPPVAKAYEPLVVPAVNAAPPPAPTEESRPATPSAPASRPFMEAAAAGSEAYRGGDFVSAEAQLRKAIEANPNDAEAHSNLGQVLVRLNRAGEALPHFDRALSLIPDRWAYHFNRARALGLLARWDDAIASYRQAKQMFPDDYATAFNLGQALHRKGDEAGAVEEYLRAITLEPNDPSFRMALGLSYERLQKRAEAAAAYQEALRLAPDAPDADRVRARIAQLTASGS